MEDSLKIKKSKSSPTIVSNQKAMKYLSINAMLWNSKLQIQDSDMFGNLEAKKLKQPQTNCIQCKR